MGKLGDDLRTALGLPSEEEKRAAQRKMDEMRMQMPSTAMHDAYRRIYDEVEQLEDERRARNNVYYETEEYLTEEDLMDEAIQWHIRNRKRCAVFEHMSSSEGFHRYAITVPHATPGRSENNKRRNQRRSEAKTSIRNLGGRIFFVDEYPISEDTMVIVYLYIIGYPTHFTGFRL